MSQTNSGTNQFIYSPALALDSDKFDVKISPRLTDKDNLVGRYSFINNNENDVQGYPILGTYPLHSRAQDAGLSYVHIISPTITAEAAISYYRMYFYFLNASNFNGKDVISEAGISGFQGLSRQQPAAPQINLPVTRRSWEQPITGRRRIGSEVTSIAQRSIGRMVSTALSSARNSLMKRTRFLTATPLRVN